MDIGSEAAVCGEGGKLLTIAIPTYNRRRYLELGLNQLEPQLKGHEDEVELLICDNASDDDTRQFVESRIAAGCPIRLLVNSENVGGDLNIAKCFRMATGKYVLVMGDDDLLLDGALEAILSTLRGRDIGVLSVGSYGYDSNFLKERPVAKEDPDRIFKGKPSKFIAQLSFMLTFTSTNVVNRSGLDFGYADELAKSSLTQVYYYVRAAYSHKENVIIGRHLVAAKRGNGSGISLFQVHGINFFAMMRRLSNEGVAPRGDFSPVRRRTLMVFLPYLILRGKVGLNSKFGDEKPFDLLFPEHRSHLTFWLFTVPPMFLPFSMARRVLAFFYRNIQQQRIPYRSLSACQVKTDASAQMVK